MKEEVDESNIILFMGTYPPRECGIATFTRDLTNAIDNRYSPAIKTKILAINKNGINIYNYPKKVIYEIPDNSIEDYITTAKKINQNKAIKMVCIQHEFGIFGGEFGDHLLAFLECIKKHVIVTFHSVLPNPNDRLKQVVESIARRVNGIVVMTKKGVEILNNHYEN